MTDESYGTDPVEGQAAPVESQAEPIARTGAGEFTSGEGLVAFAGIVLIVAYLVFGLLANTYWVAWLAMVPATAAALLPRLNRATVERYHPLPLLMKALGYWIALVGAFTIIEDLRFAGSSLDEALEIVGALVAYAGFAMAFIGARQIKI